VPKWARKTTNHTSPKSDQRDDRGIEKTEERPQGRAGGQTADPSEDRHYIGLNSPADHEVLGFH
jgi:hypothetical protein